MTPDFTDQDGVLEFLSPFWTSIFNEREISRSVASTHSAFTRQLYQDQSELINSVSIDKIPLYHKELVQPLTLRESEMSIGPLPLTYGEGFVYGSQPAGTDYREGEIFEYGGAERRSSFFYWGLPDSTVSIGATIIDSLTNPATPLLKDRDFIALGGEIVAFRANPFENSLMPVREVEDENGQIDREIVLWMVNTWSDQHYLYDKYASPFTTVRESTDSLRDFTKRLFSLYSGGPSILMIDSFIAACAEQPIIRERLEVVERVDSFKGKYLVITDKNVYNIPEGSEVRSTVSAGVELMAGEPLTNTTRVDDLLSDSSWWSTETGFMLRGSMQGEFSRGGLFFPNSFERVTPVGDDSAQFTIYGEAEAKEAFWSQVHEHGGLGDFIWRKNGILDSDGDPDYGADTLINPMQLLIEDILGVAVIAVRVQTELLPSYSRFMRRLRLLGEGVFSGAMLAFFVDYSASDEYDVSTIEEVSFAYGLSTSEVAGSGSVAEEVFTKLSPSCK